MKKAIKIILIIFAILGLLVAIGFFMVHEREPDGVDQQKADALAEQMMMAVNKPAWDTTHFIQWTFKGVHDFVWDKQRHFTKVKWDDKEVLVNLNTVTGQAFENGTALSGDANDALVKKAWEYFCNDSFWLNAVVKAFDPGTERSLVKLSDGREGLKVQYSQGGVTPGDAYVWILDENARPVSWKMWVKIIPVGGLEFTWEDWKTLSTGAQIAGFHKSSILDLDISNLKAGTQLSDLGLSADPFVKMNN